MDIRNFNNEYEYKVLDDQAYITKFLKGEEELHIPSHFDKYPVTGICSYAFEENGTEVFEIFLPETVKVIEKHAFYNCMFLMNIHLNEGLECLGEEFLMITAIDTLEIPSTVFQIDSPGTLSGIKLTVHPENPYFFSDDYGLYGIEEEGLSLLCVNSDDLRTEYKISEGTTIIGQGAFSGQNYIEKIICPDTLKSISYASFLMCDSLKEVVLNEGLVEILDDAFSRSPDLSSLHIPSTVNRITERALSGIYNWSYDRFGLCHISVEPGNEKFFADETGLYELLKDGQYKTLCFTGIDMVYHIPDNVKIIGEESYRRSRLSHVTIPESVKEVHRNAFFESKLLREIHLLEKDRFIYVPSGPYWLVDNILLGFEEASQGEVYNYEHYCDVIDSLKLSVDKIRMISRSLRSGVDRGFTDYIKSVFNMSLNMISEAEDVETLKDLTATDIFTADNIDEAIDIFNRMSKHEMVSILMDVKNSRFRQEEFDFSL